MPLRNDFKKIMIIGSGPIVIGQAVGSMWAVESGLKADELVIVEGIQKVKPDAAVQIRTSGAQES